MRADFLKKVLAQIQRAGFDSHLILIEEKSISLRLAHSQVLQPAIQSRFFAYVRLARGNHLACGQAEGAAALARAWQEAETLLAHSPESKPPILAKPIVELDNCNLPPLPRADYCLDFAAEQCRGRQDAAGMLKVESWQVAVLNSLGLLRSAAGSRAHFFLSEHSFAQITAPTLEELGRKKLELISAPGELQQLPPGNYRVLLGPTAALDLVEGIAYSGFGGREYLEGRSFLPQLKQLGDEDFNLRDDWQAAGGLPFDFEGTTRSCLPLVVGGRPQGPVGDLTTAKLLGTASSGHSLPPWEDSGPLPINLVLEGCAQEKDLLASLGDGLYIPRFHYLGLVNPKTATFTGTIRDCIQVKGGAPSGPVVPLRFTESFLDLAERIEQKGKIRQLPGSWGNNLVPPLVLSYLHFT